MTQIFKTLILASLVSISLPSIAQTPRKSAIAPKINSEILNNTNNLSLPIQAPPPIINLKDQGGTNLIPAIAPPRISTKPEKPEKIDVILENRSSGCRAIANQTINLQPNLCPKPNISVIAKTLPSNSDKQMLYPLPFIAPVTSGFGWRVHPITGNSTFHQGIDLGASTGTPVLAVYSGTVAVADWLGGLGKAVVISHGYSSESRYGHLSQILVSPGQYVKQGTVIGLVGSTGMSTGAHLHFELWQRNSGEWIALDATNAILVATDNLNRYLQSLAGR